MEKIKLLNDQPIGEGPLPESDGLGFKQYASILGQVAIDTPGPFTVGIFGEWGTGKTSLLRLIKDYLDKNRNSLTIWFNAWRYEGEDQPIVPLVATIIRELELNQNFFKMLGNEGKSLIRALRSVAYGFSAKSKVKIPGFAEIEAAFIAKDMIDRDEKLTADPFLERSLYWEAFKALSNVKLPNGKKVIVIIDDLDRCFPDNAIKLLESIKLVLAQEGFIFYIGVARRVLEGYLQHRYKKEYGILDYDGRFYLDKIVQLPFHIPPHDERMEELWKSILTRLAHNRKGELEEIIPIIGVACGSNPRAVIRFINNLIVDKAIYKLTAIDGKPEDIPYSFFAITRSLQQRWPDFFNLIVQYKPILTMVNSWITHSIPSEGKLKNNYETKAAETLKNEIELLQLLSSEFGRAWLDNDKDRTTTLSFLLSKRLNEIDSTTKATTDTVFLYYTKTNVRMASHIKTLAKIRGMKCITPGMLTRPISPLEFGRSLNLVEEVWVVCTPKTIDIPELRMVIDTSTSIGKKIVLILHNMGFKELPSSLHGYHSITYTDLKEALRMPREYILNAG